MVAEAESSKSIVLRTCLIMHVPVIEEGEAD